MTVFNSVTGAKMDGVGWGRERKARWGKRKDLFLFLTDPSLLPTLPSPFKTCHSSYSQAQSPPYYYLMIMCA